MNDYGYEKKKKYTRNFQKKIVTPLLSVSMDKFQGCRVKEAGIPGGTPKFEEKTWISSKVNAKNGIFFH